MAKGADPLLVSIPMDKVSLPCLASSDMIQVLSVADPGGGGGGGGGRGGEGCLDPPPPPLEPEYEYN